MSGLVSSLSNKQERFFQNASDVIVSDRTYNMIIGGVIAYGVLVNMLMVKFLTPLFMAMNPIVFLIGYFVLALAGTFIAYKSSNPLVSFLGYNLVVVPMGAVIALCLQGYDNGIVFQAFLMTSVVSLVMLAAATLYPGFFAKLGGMLFMGLIGLVLAELICMLIGIRTNLFSWIAAVLFSMYIGYDWVKAQRYVKTIDNAVDSALDIYMDIINLFLRILRLLGSRNNN